MKKLFSFYITLLLIVSLSGTASASGNHSNLLVTSNNINEYNYRSDDVIFSKERLNTEMYYVYEENNENENYAKENEVECNCDEIGVIYSGLRSKKASLIQSCSSSYNNFISANLSIIDENSMNSDNDLNNNENENW